MIAISWSLANPMFASPDEGQHMIRAEGVIRGQVKSPYFVPSLPVGSENCLAFQPEVTADCIALDWATNERSISTANDNYPPVFYAAVGLPTRFVLGQFAAYSMRILCALLCSALIALALYIATGALSASMGLLVAATALTPMVFFIAGMVNPSGLAASAGLCFWCAVVFNRSDSFTRVGRYHAAGFSMAILLSLRRDSVYWGVTVVLIAGLICGRRSIESFIRSRSGMFWTAACALVGVYSYLGFARGAGNSFVDNSSLTGGSASQHGWYALSWLTEYLKQHIGKFGMIDTYLPEPVYLLSYVLIGGLLFAALAFAKGRSPLILGFHLLCCLVLPVLIGYIRFPYFQARYMLPLSIGLSPFAARCLQATGLELAPRRLGVMAGVSFVILQTVALAQNQRRYAVGALGSWRFPFRNVWDPPYGSSLLLIALCAVGSVGLTITLATKRD